MLIYTKESFPGTAINTEHLMKPDKIIQQFAVDDLTIALEDPRKWKIKRTVQRRMPVCFFEGKKKIKNKYDWTTTISTLPSFQLYRTYQGSCRFGTKTISTLPTLNATLPHNAYTRYPPQLHTIPNADHRGKDWAKWVPPRLYSRIYSVQRQAKN